MSWLRFLSKAVSVFNVDGVIWFTAESVDVTFYGVCGRGLGSARCVQYFGCDLR